MKAKILIVLVIVAVIANSCSKDQFSDKPVLTFSSVNATSFPQNSQLTFMLAFTFKTVALDTLFVSSYSLVSNCQNSTVNFKYKVPDFSSVKNQKGDLEVDYVVGGSLVTCSNNNDTAYFKFWVKDKNGNLSDTVRSPNIALLK